MKRLLILLAGMSLAFASQAGPRTVTDPSLPRSLPEQGPVSVSWADPATFTEIRYSTNRQEAVRGNWVVRLAEHLRKRAEKELPAGQQLDVQIVDIQLAGNFEPWHGPSLMDTRFMRDIYPPRITLTFRQTDANGQVVAEGERKLIDQAYLMGLPVINTSDLQYEKRMIDRWVTRELDEPRV